MSQQQPIHTSILIVDDTPANLHLLSQMLIQNGYKVRAVNSGQRAIESAQANPPDLILLDIMMPDMNGYQACAHLKADALTRDVPIIFISALDATEDKVHAFTAGGVDYITKPFQLEEVLARVKTHLDLQDLHKQLINANRRLEQQVKELQTRNAELDAFAHTVAHDLKNPLTSVRGYASLLGDARVASEKKKQEIAQYILRGSQQMESIIESLLMLTGVRKQTVKIEKLDMAQIVSNARQQLAYQIEDAQAQLTQPDAWPLVWGYAPWVEAIWANFISNALKYGGQPPMINLNFSMPDVAASLPNLSAEGEPTAPPHPYHVRFWVRDNGPGLSPEEQACLFTPFTRIHQDRAEGHGLGLTIVQSIAERLGGQVGVESQVGQGSTFYFTLPGHENGYIT